MSSDPTDPERRSFLSRASTWFMASGLVAGYGACGGMAARYLYPAHRRETRWQYLAREKDLEVGASFSYRAPSGEKVAVARRERSGRAEDFVALSSTCPHLGCQVHWEPQNARFFCPCHNGAFDTEGRATEGPPFEAGQSLSRYPLRIEEGRLLIEVPMVALPEAREG